MVRSGIKAGSWRTMASPKKRALSVSPIASTPSMTMRPSSGTSAPAATAMSVDLPAPFSPMRPWTSPARTENVTLPSARTPGKTLVTLSICRSFF